MRDMTDASNESGSADVVINCGYISMILKRMTPSDAFGL